MLGQYRACVAVLQSVDLNLLTPPEHLLDAAPLLGLHFSPNRHHPSIKNLRCLLISKDNAIVENVHNRIANLT